MKKSLALRSAQISRPAEGQLWASLSTPQRVHALLPWEPESTVITPDPFQCEVACDGGRPLCCALTLKLHRRQLFGWTQDSAWDRSKENNACHLTLLPELMLKCKTTHSSEPLQKADEISRQRWKAKLPAKRAVMAEWKEYHIFADIKD
ncbi:hypothetical protein MJT46_015705 [Ovis ammon polii x Ovis aries]|nr:hypothetical protein MJT46_015705 [Ovis ammon polii x Ovis aries]